MVFLMVLHLELSLVSLFSRQKFCVFLSVVLCQLVKVANQFLQCAVYLQRENILLKHFYFFFTLEEIKYSSNLAESSDFALAGTSMIIYSGITILSVFWIELYIQY